MRKLIMCSVLIAVADVAAGQTPQPIAVGHWLSVSANLDGGYRRTQFFEADHDVALFQWDSHIDLWLPPFRGSFSWGPYLRLAGIKASKSQPWENAWLGVPGFGAQLFPFSARPFQADSVTGTLLGPLRLFAEFNAVDYWGPANAWRPQHQRRGGLDYWKAINVADSRRIVWTEIWNGAFWQSSNEFAADYNTTIVANAVRLGVRTPRRRLWSSLSPYAAVESSKTSNHDYYWENHLLLGGGIRFVPSPVIGSVNTSTWLSRFVLYAEWLHAAAYYGLVAPPAVPRSDIHVGLSVSLGDWYK